jgi:hypothetical protein
MILFWDPFPGLFVLRNPGFLHRSVGMYFLFCVFARSGLSEARLFGSASIALPPVSSPGASAVTGGRVNLDLLLVVGVASALSTQACSCSILCIQLDLAVGSNLSVSMDLSASRPGVTDL